MYTEVQRFCGAEAADWQKGFDDVLIQPILKLVGCRKGTVEYPGICDRHLILMSLKYVSLGYSLSTKGIAINCVFYFSLWELLKFAIGLSHKTN